MKLNDNKTIFVNGNALEVLDTLIIKNVVVDMIFTDPPYKVTARGNAGNSGGMLQKSINRKGKVFEYNNIEYFIMGLIKEGDFEKILKNLVFPK